MTMAARTAAIILAATVAGQDHPREPDITVTAERIPPWEMSFEDMEFVALAIDCGKRLYADGQHDAARPYLDMGARYGDVDSQYVLARLTMRGIDGAAPRPQDVLAVVGWLGVAADGRLKPDAQRMLRKATASVCAAQDSKCRAQVDAVVAAYVARYGRDASGMACRVVKGERGQGVRSFRVDRGPRRVACTFPRLFRPRDVLAEADLEAAISTSSAADDPGSEPDTAGGTARPDLAAAFPGMMEFALQAPGGGRSLGGRIRCPVLASD